MLDGFPVLGPLLALGIEHLDSLDIEPEFSCRPAATADQLDAFNDEFGLVLPDDVRAIYLETDGFLIYWEAEDERGSLRFPTLYELRLHRQRWVNGDMPDKDWTSDLDDDVADAVLNGMRVWLPFDESGCGDLMCVDCDSGYVVEYDHEWGNITGCNGTIYATSLSEYIRACSRISFYDVWIARLDHTVRSDNCWAIWGLNSVPRRFVVTG